MGSLHQLPTAASAHLRLLNQIVRETIASHPDPRIASAWADMAEQSLSRYPGPPLATHPVLDLDSVSGLSTDQKTDLAVLAQEWMEHYQHDVRSQLMQMHRDLLSLQRQIAELQLQD